MWPKWYLQSYLLGVPELVFGKRSKGKSLTTDRMSWEKLLEKAKEEPHNFDSNVALGRIYEILFRLKADCETKTGDTTCELHINSEGEAWVHPVERDKAIEAMRELTSAWKDGQSGSDVPATSTPIPSGFPNK